MLKQYETINLNEVAGVKRDYAKTRLTHQKLLTYAAENKTIYLPSHDEHAGYRLVNECFISASTSPYLGCKKIFSTADQCFNSGWGTTYRIPLCTRGGKE